MPSAYNLVACFVSLPAAPPGIPSVLWADVGAFSFPQPWLPPKGFLVGYLQFPATFSSSSSSLVSFAVPVAHPARFPTLCKRDLTALSSARPWLPTTGFLAGCLRFPATFSSLSSSLGSFSVPVTYPTRFPDLFKPALAALYSVCVAWNTFSSARASSNFLTAPSNSSSTCKITVAPSAASSP